MNEKGKRGFTLIEMSMVLVVIGLIVGGVLVGRDLIGAAAVRAQISQIEKYNTAAATFFGKYGYLPGDITPANASQFGFVTRAGTQGRGDGNGLVEGGCYSCGTYNPNLQYLQVGETSLFWVDLSTSGLIDGSFNTATDAFAPIANLTLTSTPGINQWLPQARIGGGNFIYVYVDSGAAAFGIALNKPLEYFGISVVTNIANWGALTTTTGMTVNQAYAIDRKVDDGLPQYGNVLAMYDYGGEWAGQLDQSATPGSATTCYDNGNMTGVQHYSLTQNNGNGVNCALSFRMKAAD